MPAPTGRERRPFSDARTIVEEIAYRCRAGIAWRDLPEVFGPWQTVWKWHRRMAGDGTWDRVLAALMARADAIGKIEGSVSVDSPIARAHQHATSPGSRGASSNHNTPLIEPPGHGFGRSRGGLSTKLHQLVDGHGLPLVIAVTLGQSGDPPVVFPLLQQLRVARPLGRPPHRPDRLRDDEAYSSGAIRQHLRDRGLHTVIPQPSDQIGHRVRRGSRGGRPISHDRVDYRTATSSNVTSPPSSSGEASPAAATISPPPTAQPPSSTPSSSGPVLWETHPRRRQLNMHR